MDLTLIFSFLVIMFAGINQGLSGFGFALISAPLLMLLLPPTIVVPVIIIQNTLLNILIFIESRKHVNLKRIWPLIISGIIGIPFGAYILLSLDATLMKLIVGIMIVFTSLVYLKGFKKKIKNEKASFTIIGFISGLMKGSTSMDGPPVALFFTNQGFEKREFRANLIAYFMVTGMITLLVFFIGGIIDQTIINYSILLLPATIIGMVIGMKLVKKVNDKLFRKIVLMILIISGLSAIASGFGLL